MIRTLITAAALAASFVAGLELADRSAAYEAGMNDGVVQLCQETGGTVSWETVAGSRLSFCETGAAR